MEIMLLELSQKMSGHKNAFNIFMSLFDNIDWSPRAAADPFCALIHCTEQLLEEYVMAPKIKRKLKGV